MIRGPPILPSAEGHDCPEDQTSLELYAGQPLASWAYKLVVETTLEDLAGNSIGNPSTIFLRASSDGHNADCKAVLRDPLILCLRVY
jgi:hypothetical protein